MQYEEIFLPLQLKGYLFQWSHSKKCFKWLYRFEAYLQMIKKLKKHVLINIDNVLSGKSCDVHVFSIYNTCHCLPLFKRNIDSFAFRWVVIRLSLSDLSGYLLKEKAMLCPVYLRHIFVINYSCIILRKTTYYFKILTLWWVYYCWEHVVYLKKF